VVSLAPAIEQAVTSGKLNAEALPLLRTLTRIITRNESVTFDFDSFFSQLPFATPKRIES
jgi:hypothetical protein